MQTANAKNLSGLNLVDLDSINVKSDEESFFRLPLTSACGEFGKIQKATSTF